MDAELTINTEKIETDECPHCGSSLTIPNGWITIQNNQIASIDADWRCPECGKTGKLDMGEYNDDQWRLRGRDIPENPRISNLERGTPERRAVEFLDYWKQDNYQGMAKFIPPSEDVLDQSAPDIIKEFFQDYELKHFLLQSVDVIAPVLASAIAKINVSKSSSDVEEQIQVGMVRQDKEGCVDPEGKWYVMDRPTLG